MTPPSVLATIVPLAPTATQMLVVAQAMPCRSTVVPEVRRSHWANGTAELIVTVACTVGVAFADDAEPASLLATTVPASPTARHDVLVGQLRPSSHTLAVVARPLQVVPPSALARMALTILEFPA